MMHWNHNKNRKSRKKPDGTHRDSPWKEATGGDHKETLVPFGVSCYVLRDGVPLSDKFSARAELQAVFGYGPNASYKVLNVKQMRATGKFSYVTTRASSAT